MNLGEFWGFGGEFLGGELGGEIRVLGKFRVRRELGLLPEPDEVWVGAWLLGLKLDSS